MFQGFGMPEGVIGCLLGGGGAPQEYLTIQETAQRLKLSPKTVRNKMSSQVFKCGVHYFRAPSLGPRFKWSAIEKWLESENSATQQEEAGDEIPMARGYALGRARVAGMRIAHEQPHSEELKDGLQSKN
jgi:hypothetical protein